MLTKFVFGLLIALFIFVGLVIAGLVLLEWRLSQMDGVISLRLMV